MFLASSLECFLKFVKEPAHCVSPLKTAHLMNGRNRFNKCLEQTELTRPEFVKPCVFNNSQLIIDSLRVKLNRPL
jgi:hypothetical protein